MDYESDTKGNIIYSSNAEYLVYVTIGIVYVTLVSLLIDRVLGYDKIESDCKYRFMPNMTLEQQEEEEGRRGHCEGRRNEYQDKRFSHMMIVGVISLLVGGYVTTLDGSYNVAGAGVALGGVFGIIYTSVSNWHRITTDLKIFMLAASLVTLAYGSTRVF
jgi:uncharacterized membrane protein